MVKIFFLANYRKIFFCDNTVICVGVFRGILFDKAGAELPCLSFNFMFYEPRSDARLKSNYIHGSHCRHVSKIGWGKWKTGLSMLLIKN